MKNFFNKVNGFLNKGTVKLLRLTNNNQGVEIVQMLLLTAVVVVIIAMIFFPQMSAMVTGSFDGANEKLADIWGFRG